MTMTENDVPQLCPQVRKIVKCTSTYGSKQYFNGIYRYTTLYENETFERSHLSLGHVEIPEVFLYNIKYIYIRTYTYHIGIC